MLLQLNVKKKLEVGELGLYLRYTDGMEEWTAISLFVDTVVEVESTKK